MSPLLPVALALLAAVQQPSRAVPTVGDTVWVRRSIRLPDRYTARAADWELTGDVELLGPPQLVLGNDSVTVRYPLVAWTAGTHRVEVPSPTLLAPDGSVDSLGPAAVTFTVRSLLPDRPPSQLQPQPPAGLVSRQTVSLLPPVLFLAAAAALLLPLHWWWRRRGRPLPPPESPPQPAVPLDRWADAGEARSVLALASARIRGAIARAEPEAHERLDPAACIALLAERRPDWPVAQIASLLRALDAARFAPGSGRDAGGLYRSAEALAGRLEPAVPA